MFGSSVFAYSLDRPLNVVIYDPSDKNNNNRVHSSYLLPVLYLLGKLQSWQQEIHDPFIYSGYLIPVLLPFTFLL
jgi:hypothetical protein